MNHTHNESAAPSTSSTTRTSLRRLYALEGRTQPETANPIELATWLAPLFDFLPKPISFEVGGDELVIRYPSEAQSAKMKAEEMFNRAVKRASQGDYEAVARLCRRALEKQPSLHEARRILARACIELNDLGQAKPILVQVALCDPGDAWALTALGSICLREGDNERAERFTTLSLSFEPRNAVALTNLGMLYQATGRAEHAVEVLQQAIEIAPSLSDPRYALAKLLADQGKFKESAAVVEGLLASAKPLDKASARTFESARRCYAACQSELARQGHETALRTIRELHDETEKLVGCPIRISYEDTSRLPGGSSVPMALAHDPNNGIIKCQLQGPENARPHLVASALLRIQGDWEAATGGNKRGLVVTNEQILRIASHFDPRWRHLSTEARSQFGVFVGRTSWVLFYTLTDSAPQMLVDQRMQQRFPELRPSQFLSRSQNFIENWQARERLKSARLPMPRLLERTLLALCGLDALFLDDLFGRTTDLASRCQSAEGFDLSRKLWQHWRSKSASMKPGDEYAILEDFTEILGLSDWCGWAEAPFFAGGSGGFPSM